MKKIYSIIFALTLTTATTFSNSANASVVGVTAETQTLEQAKKDLNDKISEANTQMSKMSYNMGVKELYKHVQHATTIYEESEDIEEVTNETSFLNDKIEIAKADDKEYLEACDALNKECTKDKIIQNTITEPEINERLRVQINDAMFWYYNQSSYISDVWDAIPVIRKQTEQAQEDYNKACVDKKNELSARIDYANEVLENTTSAQERKNLSSAINKAERVCKQTNPSWKSSNDALTDLNEAIDAALASQATGIKNTETTTDIIRKSLKNGKVVIINGTRTFNTAGAEL